MKGAAMRSVTAPVDWSTVFVLAIAIGIYSLGILSWIFALRYLPLSLAYPLTSLNYVGILAGSSYWFGEQLSAARMIGVAFIFIGVLLIVLRAREATAPVAASGGR
jgi:drug/metabolite transporter (DMT)-like permease